MQSHRCCLLAAFFVAMSLEATAATWTVNKHGPADFSEIQDAINAASDGDVILVSSGGYLPIVIDGKALSIVAKNGASLLNVLGTTPPGNGSLLTIRNLASHQHCLIEALQLTNFSAAVAAVLIEDNDGPVWIQHMFVDSYNAGAMRIERSDSVSIHDCDAQTNTTPAAPDGTPQPRPGLRVVDSRVISVASTYRGSHAATVGLGFPTPTAPAPGGAGCEVVDSVVDFQGGEIHGGSGGSMFVSGCSFGGNGGTGLELSTLGGAAPSVSLRATSVAFGYGGFYTVGCSKPPPNRVAKQSLPGTLVGLPAPARVVTGFGYTAGGASFALSLSGGASEVVALFAGPQGAAIPLGVNTLHLVQPMIFLGVIPLPQSGKATIEFITPVTPPGAPVAIVGLQAFFAAPSGALIASGPLAIAVD